MNLARVITRPNASFFLFGCRGTGKSTWLRTEFKDAKFFNLLDETLYQEFLANPARFFMELRPLPSGSWVVVDEVQRLPNLLNQVHQAIEELGLKFVLCGSSARKLKAAGVNLLAGRASKKLMFPFLPEELQKFFVLEDALAFGTLPIVWASEDKKERLSAYTQLYLKEEIQAEALVRNLPGFARFLPIAAMYNAKLINVSNISREAGVARTTVNGYLEILEDTMMCFKLPAYETKLRVRERKLPKLYWTDPGIVRGILRRFEPPAPDERGNLFEAFLAQYLRASFHYRGIEAEMHYWSPAQSAVEVDFLIEKSGKFTAIEAKSGRNFTDSWLSGLRAIKELSGLERRIVVCPETGYSKSGDGIEIMPFSMLVDQVSSGKLLG